MCYDKPRWCIGGTWCVICVGWALGIFFGLNYPEIRRNTVFVSSNCTVHAPVQVVPYRYCYKTCSYCASYYGDTCGAKHAIDESIDKYDLSVATEAQIEGSCDDGYVCCHEHCDTCTRCSCSRRLTSSRKEHSPDDDFEFEEDNIVDEEDTREEKHTLQAKSTFRKLLTGRMAKDTRHHQNRRLKKSGCTRTCTTYSCNCRCVTSTYHHMCSYSCIPHYETHVPVSFPWRPDGAPVVDSSNPDGAPIPSDQVVVTVTAVRDFAASLGEATQHLSRFPVNSYQNGTALVYSCVYDPTWNPHTDAGRYNQITEVWQLAFTDWELGYTAGWWLLFGVPAFNILLFLMFCSGEACRLYCCRDRYYGRRRRTWCGGREILIRYWNVALWFGTLLPFALFLPIELKGKLIDEDTDSIALNWTVYVLAGLGWAPMLHYLTAIRFQVYSAISYNDDQTSAGLLYEREYQPLETRLGTRYGIAPPYNSRSSKGCVCAQRLSASFGRKKVRKRVHKIKAFICVFFGWVIPVAAIAPLPFCAPWGLLHPLPLGLVFVVLVIAPECFRPCSRSGTGTRSTNARIIRGAHSTDMNVAYDLVDSINSNNESDNDRATMAASASVASAPPDTSSRLKRMDSHRLRVDRLQQEIHPNADENKDESAMSAATGGKEQNNRLGSVPLYYPSGETNTQEAEELICMCSIVNTTSELLTCFEKLRALNVQGKMSQVQRGNLVANMADRRRSDDHFRDVVWTIPETSVMYGKLLMS